MLDRARPPDGPSPEDIITATMRRLLADGQPISAEYGAKQILVDLGGHRYELVHRPARPEYCDVHTSTRNPCGLCAAEGR